MWCGHSGCRESPRGVPCTPLSTPHSTLHGLGPGSPPRAARRCRVPPPAFLDRGSPSSDTSRHRRCLRGRSRQRLQLWGRAGRRRSTGGPDGRRGPLSQPPGPAWGAPEHGAEGDGEGALGPSAASALLPAAELRGERPSPPPARRCPGLSREGGLPMSIAGPAPEIPHAHSRSGPEPADVRIFRAFIRGRS